MTVTYRPLEGSGSRGILGLEGFATGPCSPTPSASTSAPGFSCEIRARSAPAAERPTAYAGMREQAAQIFADIAKSLDREGGPPAPLCR